LVRDDISFCDADALVRESVLQEQIFFESTIVLALQNGDNNGKNNSSGQECPRHTGNSCRTRQ
jgi:hypothetical protein